MNKTAVLNRKQWSLLLVLLFLFASPIICKAARKVGKQYRESAKHYRFDIGKTFPSSRNLSGSAVAPEVAEAELNRFFEALDDLGLKFVRKSGLKKVIICRDLKLNGMPCGGVASGSTILMNVGFSKKTVYHEMFHIFDSANEDKSWQRLNHKKFMYRKIDFPDRPVSRGHKSKLKKRDQKYGHLNFDKDFASRYAQSNEKEDRAETFAFMVAGGKNFTARAMKSPALWGKMHYIIEVTSCRSLLDEDYWRKKLGPEAMNKNRFKKRK
jgi:hypothetical protein